MKALISRAVGHVEYGDWPEPQLPPGEVLVRVTACGICGTDLHVYRGLPVPWPLPGVRGHELAGTVADVADDVQDFAVGEGVVVQPIVHCGRCRRCRAGLTNLCANGEMIGGKRPGGHAEFVAVPAERLFRVPASLDLAQAALTETLATPVRLFRTHAPALPQTVAIFGGGPQGLLCLQMARRAGASRVAVSEVVPQRRALAEALGATVVIDPLAEDPAARVMAMTEGEGAELVIEAAGNGAARRQALEVVRWGGVAVFVAIGSGLTEVDFNAVSFKEAQLRGSQAYTDADFAVALNLLASGAIDAEAVVSEASLGDGPAMYEALTRAPGELVKVLLRP